MLLSTPSFQSRLRSSRFLEKTLHDLRFSPVCAKCPTTFIPTDVIMLIILHEQNTWWSSTFCRSPQLLLLSPCYVQMFSLAPYSRTLPVWYHASHLYKITGKVLRYVFQSPQSIALCISISANYCVMHFNLRKLLRYAFQSPHLWIAGRKIKYSEKKSSKHSPDSI
jgi:hypothetical protein